MSGTEDAVTKTPQQQFEDNIRERITKDIGSLIPDEVLADYVAKAVHSAFFEPTKKTNYDYGRPQTVEGEPWFVAFMKAAAQKKVDEAVDKFFKDNPDMLGQKVAEIVGDITKDGLIGALTRYMEYKIQRAGDGIVINAMKAMDVSDGAIRQYAYERGIQL